MLEPLIQVGLCVNNAQASQIFKIVQVESPYNVMVFPQDQLWVVKIFSHYKLSIHFVNEMCFCLVRT